MKNFYDLLGVNKDASDAEIKQAYKRALLRHHPDKLTSQASSASTFTIQEIQEVFLVLSNTEQRICYNASLRSRSHEESLHTLTSDVPIQWFEMDHDEVSDCLKYPCRCGHHFSIFCQDVPRRTALVNIPCTGCSLYIQVQFDE